VHVSGLRRRPVGVVLAEGAKLALLASGDLAEVVALGVRVPAPVVLAVAAVERVHAEAHEAVVALASVGRRLQLLGEVVLVRLELDLRVSVLAPLEPALPAVDEVVAEAEELVHDGLVLGEVLGDVLDDVLVLVASAGRRDRDEVRVLGDHRARVIQWAREHSCHLRLNLRHLVLELLLDLRLLELRLRLRQLQLRLLLH